MAGLGSMPCIVCDNGTGFVKVGSLQRQQTTVNSYRHNSYWAPQVGYAGENFPRSIFPSMVGRPILRAEEAVSENVVLKEIMVRTYRNQITPALISGDAHL
jgi:actin-related protein 2